MDMEDERIGLVLLRASELRSKIANCIPKTTSSSAQTQIDDGDNPNRQSNEHSSSSMEDDDADGEEAETLLNICDALDSLESQLSSLQALQQQQQYEREAVMGEIEYSRKMLLKKIGEYKGEHLDVIQEAEAFASMKVEHNNELQLPPYPTRRSLVLDNGNLNRVSYPRKPMQNGYNNNNGELPNGSKRTEPNPRPNKLWGGLKFLVHSTAKTMVTLVGVISLLTLAGFEPRLSKKGVSLKSLTLSRQPDDEEEKGFVGQCPPGRVAVMEDGEVRCIVKERVEIPFDSVAENADVNYGCG